MRFDVVAITLMKQDRGWKSFKMPFKEYCGGAATPGRLNETGRQGRLPHLYY